MARNTKLREKRDEYVRKRFRYHRKKNPKWTIIAVIEQVAEEVFISPVTVGKILKQSNDCKITHPTIKKYVGLQSCV